LNDDGALISYKLRKTVKQPLSVTASAREAAAWLMSMQRAMPREDLVCCFRHASRS
jgi:hypothetical protein